MPLFFLSPPKEKERGVKELRLNKGMLDCYQSYERTQGLDMH